MKHRLRALACASLVAAGLAAAPAANATIAGDTEGCTPGYWKQSQHFHSWDNAEAKPTDLFSAKFNMTSSGTPTVLKGKSMVQALQGGGGSGLDGARVILARAAAAAWLNSAYDDVNGHLKFPWRRYGTGFDGEPPLVSTVKTALQGSDRNAMTTLAAQLDADNNLGCPLS
jgi:hypothetical protein